MSTNQIMNHETTYILFAIAVSTFKFCVSKGEYQVWFIVAFSRQRHPSLTGEVFFFVCCSSSSGSQSPVYRLDSKTTYTL